ncbi:MAG TPA: 16S rRNA (cytidine(1402)-2'-O)-methyltransferase [Solirubrobacteraceae bacterium]|nr:16S rRNA (cytidine(1402)-2'-O)-methyltransferase [Solirubrobacteraceae bacterium]
MIAPEAPVGRLLVCPTPIGNLGDVTLRVLEALAGADAIACEDTRHTRGLLDRHGIAARELLSFHEHNEPKRARELCERIRGGQSVALVSDAGTPLLSDPGYQLVQICLAEGLPVEVLPGPSAPVTALVASGLPGARWCFAGFLPRKRGELLALFAAARETLVAFESPRRLAASLAVLAELDPSRRVSVCRELTKLHEEVVRGSASELAARFAAAQPRGEIVIVVEAPAAGVAERGPALEALRELVAAGARPRPAAAAVAKLSGLAANELYRELTGSGG